VSRKKKLILIGVAIALAVGVGGLAYAKVTEHQDVGGHKLIGVGEMGYYYNETIWEQYEWWDTNFIITNPNCDKYITIEWVSLIAGDGSAKWDAEEVIAEGTPDDWNDWFDYGMGTPKFGSIPDDLSPHEVWQVSITELLSGIFSWDPYVIIDESDLSKYTLEVTWSGVKWRGWWGWSWWGGCWGYDRPLVGWQKEKCGTYTESMDGAITIGTLINSSPYWNGFTISEAHMQVFPNRNSFRAGEPIFPMDER